MILSEISLGYITTDLVKSVFGSLNSYKIRLTIGIVLALWNYGGLLRQKKQYATPLEI